MRRSYHTNDGDCYYTSWSRKRETAEPVISIHNYENRVQASDSVFNYQEVTEETARELGLFDYPRLNGYSCNTVLSAVGIKDIGKIQKEFNYLQGKLGPSRQLRVWVLLFKDKPRAIANEQEAYWKGGNKNEFIFCIGLDKNNKVDWCEIISWTEVQLIKIEARQLVENMETLELNKIVEFVEGPLNKQWRRKEFVDFSYLKVNPPLWMILLSYFITALVSIGLTIWLVNNEYSD